MARSSYIYMVHRKFDNKFIGGFTVKYEANIWAKNLGIPLSNMQLSRARDGYHDIKTAINIPWDN